MSSSSSEEYIKYEGIPTTANKGLTVEQSIELQRWILDPSSIPYDKRRPETNNSRLIARSAAVSTTADTKEKENKPLCQREIIERSLELQRMIIGDAY